MRSLQLVEFGAPLEWREQPTPEPAGAEVLLETLATGVCHSDLHLWDGYYGDGPSRTYVKDRGVRLPITLGHEIVGRVVAAGPDAEGVAVGRVEVPGDPQAEGCVRAKWWASAVPPGRAGAFEHGVELDGST